MATTAPQNRHTVTAIIVAHDGARLLPGLVRALRSQTYPVEQTVGIDTASRDRSGAVLAELIGQDAVFGMERATGYGEAVAVAVRHATRRRSGLTDPGTPRVEWVWLLHDDCEPAPDALERLLWGATRDPSVAVAGPKVRDARDRRTLLEAGISIDRAGRRITGIDRGEIDQGQHDHKRDVLAVGSAGMLVRRDVWDRLGGFDTHLRMFRDDIDFCWRAQAVGYRVQVVTDAVLYHRELAARRRRPVAGASMRRLDRANALYVLAANLPVLTMLWMVGGSVIGSLARACYFLLTKQLDLSAAYAYSVANLFAHPVRLARARRRRRAGLADGYNAVRMFIPPARTLFRLAERIAGLISNGPPQQSGGHHQASADESEEDEQFTDKQSVVRRLIGQPGVQLFTVLLVVALVAERRLLGADPLGGGALVPAWGGAAALWREYLAGFHAVSLGSTASASPYLAVVAALATVLGGQAWLAVDVLLLGCVPLAGLTAYLATRWLASAPAARVLLAASYALLPAATGAIAAGRLGTAVAFAVLPLIAVSAGRMLTAAPRQARRAAWAAGLLIALAAAFAPLTWVLGTAFALAALAARRWLFAVSPVNAVIVAVTPFLVLFPWSLRLLSSPSAFLTEAGLSSPGLTTRGLGPAALFALDPGGPGVPPEWVTAGFALALLALLLPARLTRPGRTGLVVAGWAVAVAGLLAAVVVSRISVAPTGGGQPADAWPGVALALAALGLLLASAPAAELLVQVIRHGSAALTQAGGKPGWGQAESRAVWRVLAGIALAAVATVPLLVACYWVADGVRGPVQRITAPVVPAFVTAAAAAGEQYRTLIVRPDSQGGLNYEVVRQGDPTLGEPELGTDAAAGAALNRVVAALGAVNGADAGDPGQVLGQFGIRYVLLPTPVDAALAQRLDAAMGLVALSKAPTYDLWQVSGTVARVRVVAPDGTVTALSSGAVNLGRAQVPASGGTLIVAEPRGGWTAKVNGQALKPLPAPVAGWAQGFTLPPGGGQLTLTRDDLARHVSLLAELVMLLAVGLLALPGKRGNPVEEAQALAALREARDSRRAAAAPRRARPAAPAQPAADETADPAVTPVPGTPDPDRKTPVRPAPDREVRAHETSDRETLVRPAPDREVHARETPDRDTSDRDTPDRLVPDRPAPDWAAPDWAAQDHGGTATAESSSADALGPLGESARAARAWSSAETASGWTAEGPAAPAPLWETLAAAPVAPETPVELTPPGPAAAEQEPLTSPAWSPASWDTPSPWDAKPEPAGAWDTVGDWGGTSEDSTSKDSTGDSAGSRGTWPESPAESPPGPPDTWAESLTEEAPLGEWLSSLGSASPASGADAEPDFPWESDLAGPSATATGAHPAYQWDSDPAETITPAAGPSATATGAHPAYQWDSDLAETTAPAAEAAEQSRFPWEPDSRPLYPWESDSPRPAAPTGEQSAVPSADTQPRYPWDSAEPRYPWDSAEPGRAAPTGGQPAAVTGAQPTAVTGAQPAAVPPAAAPPAATSGQQPAAVTGEQPAERAPWEADPWISTPEPPAGPAPVSLPEQAEAPLESGGYPATAQSARPERHPHRAKHGRPSRWRGNPFGGGA